MWNIFRNAGFEFFTAVLMNIQVTDVSKDLCAFIFSPKLNLSFGMLIDIVYKKNII